MRRGGFDGAKNLAPNPFPRGKGDKIKSHSLFPRGKGDRNLRSGILNRAR